MEAYTTISGTATATIVEKKSEFIASASFAESEEAAQALLNTVRTRHRTARHNVYAYLLREGGRTRYSDDGEPAKTAGLPVLEVVRHSGLTDIIVVVTRYFGGILLGTGGLVRAYTAAAQAAIENAEIVTVQPVRDFTLALEYSLYEQALRLLEAAGAKVTSTDFASGVTVSATLLGGREEPLLVALQELCRGEPDALLSEPYYAPF